MRNKIGREKELARSVLRAEHESAIAGLQLEIADLTARLAESRAREMQLSKLPSDAEQVREMVAGLESQLGRTEMDLKAAKNRIKELERDALRPAREQGIAA
jgi:septal ring factor EnvC (AmiA/AmiB activator)